MIPKRRYIPGSFDGAENVRLPLRELYIGLDEIEVRFDL